MPKYDDAISRDANHQVFDSNEAFLLIAPWTFVTATTGATGAHTLFTVTGDILATVFGVCTVNLAGAATLEVGVASNTAQLLAQIANTTTLDAGDVYVDADTEVGAGVIPHPQIVGGGADIIATIGSTAITAGQVNFYLLYRPLSSDAAVSVTTPA